MTQGDLECSHQRSNSVYDQVNDDSNKSKNNAASNQMNGARSNTISGETDATDRVFGVSGRGCEESDCTTTDFGKPEIKIRAVKSGNNNNNSNLEMTVITHQTSGENIREIQTKIENSGKHADSAGSSDSTEIVKKGCEDPKESVTSDDVNKKQKEDSSTCSENKVNTDNDGNSEKSEIFSSDNKGNDDPFARLKALKANISNALKEVKAVLNEHGEVTNESEKEDIKPTEDNAIRFRFVKRIRKKSIIFDEDEEKKKEPETKKEFSQGENVERITPLDNKIESQSTPANTQSIDKLKHVDEAKISTERVLPDHQTGQKHESSTSPTHVPKQPDPTVLPPPNKKADSSVIPCSVAAEKSTTPNNVTLQQAKDEVLYQVKVVEFKADAAKENGNLISTATSRKNSIKEVAKASATVDDVALENNQKELLYQVKVVESKPMKENNKLTSSQVPRKINDNITLDNVTLKEDKNEVVYQIKVVENKETAESLKANVKSTSTHTSREISTEDTLSVEKTQKKTFKTKSKGNQTTQSKEKAATKTDSKKNELLNNKSTSKDKKPNQEIEISKKSRRNNKEISKTEPAPGGKRKVVANNTTNSSKSKNKKTESETTKKLLIFSEHDTKTLVPATSEDITPTSSKNLASTTSENAIPILPKSVAPITSKNLSPPVSNNTISAHSKDPVPAPHKDVVPAESKEITPAPRKDLQQMQSKKEFLKGAAAVETQDKGAQKNEFHNLSTAEKPVQGKLESKQESDSKKVSTGQQNCSKEEKLPPSESNMTSEEPATSKNLSPPVSKNTASAPPKNTVSAPHKDVVSVQLKETTSAPRKDLQQMQSKKEFLKGAAAVETQDKGAQKNEFQNLSTAEKPVQVMAPTGKLESKQESDSKKVPTGQQNCSKEKLPSSESNITSEKSATSKNLSLPVSKNTASAPHKNTVSTPHKDVVSVQLKETTPAPRKDLQQMQSKKEFPKGTTAVETQAEKPIQVMAPAGKLESKQESDSKKVSTGQQNCSKNEQLPPSESNITSETLAISKNLSPPVSKNTVPAHPKDTVSAPHKDVVSVQSKEITPAPRKDLEQMQSKNEFSKGTTAVETQDKGAQKNEFQNLSTADKLVQVMAPTGKLELKQESDNKKLPTGQQNCLKNGKLPSSQSSITSEENPPKIVDVESIPKPSSSSTKPSHDNAGRTTQSPNITDVPTPSKSGPTSALEKVLATTNLKLVPDVRFPALIQTPKTGEQKTVQHKSTSDPLLNEAKITPNLEQIATEEPSPLPTDLKSQKKAEDRSHSPIQNDVTNLETTLMPSSPDEKKSKPQNSKRTHQHTPTEKEEKDHDDNITPKNKIGNVDIPRENDAKTNSEMKPVDKVKIPLKIESNKIGAVAIKPALNLLPSPVKAVKLVPSKLELVPVSKPNEIAVIDVRPKEDKAEISSESIESHLISEDARTESNTEIPSCKMQEQQESTVDKKEAATLENTTKEEKKQEEIEEKAGSKKRKMKKKVVIKRIKRRLSTDSTATGRQDSIESVEPEICEKEIVLKPAKLEQEPEPEPEPEEEKIPPGPKSCLKVREYQPGDIVLYADRIKKIVKWKKATVLERITSISYKLNVEGEEKSCHICYMKKYTGKKVQFGGKEYLEIDYAQEEEEEEEEEYNIWARV